MTAFSVRDLQKTYSPLFGRGGQRALAGVNLAVERGAAFGLIGPNGAGKTTFIKALLGIVRPDSGEVRVLGGDPEDPRIRARIGYLPERLHLPQSLTPLAFLQSVARLKGLRATAAELGGLLERVGLADAIGRKLGGFSKGMRQRAGLAAALVGRPELLILDEPTDGIDPLGRVEIREILAAELARGATLFLNSHLLAETERICTRIGILSEGRILREGSLEQLTRVEARWRVRFAPGSPAQALTAAGFVPASGDLWLADFADAQALNAALDRARAAGAVLTELAQDLQDLERVLKDALRAAA